jgi:hypothetical protein
MAKRTQNQGSTPKVAKNDGKKTKVAKVAYPHKEKLTEVPPDFDPAKHLPLKISDFEEKWQFMLVRADKLEEQAAKLRADAEEQKKFGDKKTRKTVKRLKGLASKVAEARKALIAAGVSEEEITAMLSGNADGDDES